MNLLNQGIENKRNFVTKDINESPLEKSPFSGIAVPLLIIVLGALIVVGISKMLSAESGYKKLVEELHSKTFGNRWVAAYELSKYIAGNKIPAEDIPWLVENLNYLYKNTEDPRTRNFIVLAIGATNSSKNVDLLLQATEDSDAQVVFNAVVSLANQPAENLKNLDWSLIAKLLTKEDIGIKQVALAALGYHKQTQYLPEVTGIFETSTGLLHYYAAITMAYFNQPKAVKTFEKIFQLTKNEELNDAQIEELMLSSLAAINSNAEPEKSFVDFLKVFGEPNKNIRVSTKAREILIRLKK